MKKKLFSLVFFYFCFYTNTAHAYLDPGTGSFILQILAFILAFFLSIWTYFKIKVKNLFNKIFKKKNKN